MKNYILNHEFICNGSYNKLMLRNSNDLKLYIEDVIDTALVASMKNNTITFEKYKHQLKIVVNKLK